MSGLSIGILSGLVVAAVGVAALSLSTPLPPRVDAEMAVEAALPVADPVAQADTVEQTPVEETPAEEMPVEEVMPEAAPAEAADPASDPAPQTPAESAEPATEIPLPSGTEFNRPPPEPEAALPSAETAPTATAPQAPALASDTSAPTFDTSTAAQPAVGADAPAALTLSADPGAVVAASPVADAAPAAPSGPVALNQPEAAAAPDIDTAVLVPVEEAPVEEVPVEDAAVAVEEVVIEDTPEVFIAEITPEPEPEAVPLQTPRFPTIGDGADDAANTMPQTPQAPADAVASLATPLFPQTSGLPQAIPDTAPEDDVAETPAPENLTIEDNGPLPAIRAHAADFDPEETRPLLAVVLIDEPDSRIELSTLTRFTFPVAFAIDPLHPDAAARAAQFREAGFEVVILGSMIAEGATAADVEVALSAAEEILPEAVAVLDTPEGRIQADRPVLDAVVGALAETGHGLVAFPRGLNAAEQSANRLGVPGATVFRLLDDENERATVITRFLGRAAFSAAQEGTVIVVGHTRPDTVTALFSWALGGRSEGVALAPLSATIERSAGL